MFSDGQVFQENQSPLDRTWTVYKGNQNSGLDWNGTKIVFFLRKLFFEKIVFEKIVLKKMCQI